MWGRTKYKSVKVNHAGQRFDSKLEASVFDILSLLERAGHISELHHHPGTIFLTDARIQYRPDFTFFDKDGTRAWAEAKGFPTPMYQIKKKLWKFYGPGKLYIYTGSYKYPKCTDILGGD